MASEGSVRSNLYNVLGIRKDASVSDIRTAYRKLAMKWHPDRYARNPGVAGEAKRRFQQIQEAYSVLQDENKRSMYESGRRQTQISLGGQVPPPISSGSATMYDAGLYDPHHDDDQDFCEFMQEMISMMNNVKDEVEGESLQDWQRMFTDVVGGDGLSFDCNNNPRVTKRPRVNVSRSSAAMR